jgi:hypothetical protein
MRVARIVFSVSISFLLSFCIAAQQTDTSNPQALLLLRQALSVLAGGQTITDVTLSGAAHRITGSDDETGTVGVKALATGAMRLDFSLSSGQRSEVRSNSSGEPSGDWSGRDGVSHSIPSHNLVTDWGWFPAITLSNLCTSARMVFTYVGMENRNGHSVQHLTAKQHFPNLKGKSATLMQHLSEMDIYLESSTSLPVSLVYNIHPDSDAGVDIPVEIDFSDYRTSNGMQIPFHVQKYLNNVLSLDLQFQSVAVNTGLAASAFSVQ